MSNDLPDDFTGDLVSDIVSSEPGLDALLAHLTADPTPDELAAERSALAMFRASRAGATLPSPPADLAQAAPPPASPAPDAARPRGRRARRRAAAAALAAAAGLIAAAYTESLPAPLQNAAYHVLGFAGIPQAGHRGPTGAGRGPAGTSPPGRAPTTPASGLRSVPPAARPSASPARRPGPAPTDLTLTVTSGRIAAGAGETFTGSLTSGGRPVAGASLGLLERTARHPAWHEAGTATTGADGRGTLTVPGLTTNAEFRLAGPDGTLSRPALVIVVPPVSAVVVTGPPGQPDLVTASSPLADPGDAVVLQVQLPAGRWVSVQAGRLNGGDQVGFPVRAGRVAREYRVVLLPTAIHGRSVSNTVAVPRASGAE